MHPEKLYQFSLIILKIESAIEDSLDVLNERYNSLYEISQKPVFFDSVEIRQVINEIKLSQDAIYAVAEKMIKDNPEVKDAVKDLRDKQKKLEDALKKHYGV